MYTPDPLLANYVTKNDSFEEDDHRALLACIFIGPPRGDALDCGQIMYNPEHLERALRNIIVRRIAYNEKVNPDRVIDPID